MSLDRSAPTTSPSLRDSSSNSSNKMAPPCPNSLESGVSVASRRGTNPGSEGGARQNRPAPSPAQMSREEERLAALAADDAPPELDALRPTFSSATRIPARRGLPVTLPPVGVRGGNDATSPRLPSLFQATSASGDRSTPSPPDTGGKQWASSRSTAPPKHWRERGSGGQYDYGGDLASTPGSSSTPAPLAGVGMRARTETDPGPSRALLEAAKIAAAAAAAADSQNVSPRGSGEGGDHRTSGSNGGSGSNSNSVREYPRYRGPALQEGSRRTAAYIQNRSLSGEETPLHHVVGVGQRARGRAVREGHRFSAGGDMHRSLTPRPGADAADSVRRSSSGGGGSGDIKSEASSRAVGDPSGGTGGSKTGEGGGGDGKSGAGGGGGSSVRVRIRGGGIDITSLLSEDTDAKAGPDRRHEGHGDLWTQHSVSGGGGGAGSPGDATSVGSAPPTGFNGYHRQDSTASASSAGEFTYHSLAGIGAGGGGGGGGSGRGGSLSQCNTPSSHTASGSEYFRGDWPGGRPPLVRKRSLTVAMDEPGGAAVCPSPRGRRRSVDKVLDTKDGHPEVPAVGIDSPSCPPRILPAPTLGSSGIVPVNSGGGSGCFSPRIPCPSPHTGGGNSSSSGGAGGPGPSPAHERFQNPHAAMEVEWIPGESNHAAAVMSASTTATPSPATSAVSASQGSALGQSSSPFGPSPGRDFLRMASLRAGAPPQSPSPRRAPPSPAQAPGSAGLRRRTARRMSGSGRASARAMHRMGMAKGMYGAGAGSGEFVAGSSGNYESDYDSDLSDVSGYSAVGSLERQLQQDTFFELDEALWHVVTRREICTAEKCVYRDSKTMVSVRKHYHATCPHIHQEGAKKGMRFHHHQLEKVKKHQRSHSSHLARVPREPGMASPSTMLGRARSLDAHSPREVNSSGGEEDGEEDEPWSAREIELLDSLVRTFGAGKWGAIAGSFGNRSPNQCARQWALGSRVHHHVPSSGGIVDYGRGAGSGGGGGGGVGGGGGTVSVVGGGAGGRMDPGICGGWNSSAIIDRHHPHHHHTHHPHPHPHHPGQAMAPADGTGLVGGGVHGVVVADHAVRMPLDYCTPSSRQSRGGMPGMAGHVHGGVVGPGVGLATPFGSPSASVGSSGRGPKGVGSWTKEEDDRLNALVAAFGVKWSQIAEHMPGRVGKQCRERYLNHLDPSLRHGPWTEEEEALLLSLHARLKNQWAEIARQIPGRSDNDVKNRWNLVCRRERAAEKSLLRAASTQSAAASAAAVSATSASSAPPRHGRTLSSGTAEMAAVAAVQGHGTSPRGDEGGGGRSAGGDKSGGSRGGGGGGGGGGGNAAAATASGGGASQGGHVAAAAEDDQSVIEAREAAEAGAGLVKLSLTAASAARAALEHSNFDAGGGGNGLADGNSNTDGNGNGGGGASAPKKRPPTPPISPRYNREGQSAPMLSPRFAHAQQQQQSHHHHHQQHLSVGVGNPVVDAASPRYSRRDGHPPRSPTRQPRSPSRERPRIAQSIQGYRGSGGGPPPPPPPASISPSQQQPYSPRASGHHHQPLAIPRSPASGTIRSAGGGGGGGGGMQATSGMRRGHGVSVDVDAPRAALAARAAAGGAGVSRGGGGATWSWGSM